MLGEAYSQNQKDLKLYYAAIEARGQAQWKGFRLNRDDQIRRDVIKQLICNFQLNFAEIAERYDLCFNDYFAQDLALLQTFIDDGLVTRDDVGIRVNATGRLLIRNICMCFDIYLRQRARQQQFSRVI
jgi:oxygen-independent coproporphyrinogen-3 oxidase